MGVDGGSRLDPGGAHNPVITPPKMVHHTRLRSTFSGGVRKASGENMLPQAAILVIVSVTKQTGRWAVTASGEIKCQTHMISLLLVVVPPVR
jgi:hypothetical protein